MATTSAQTDRPVIDLAELIDRQGVTMFNILIIAVGWFAIFGDGFDIAVIGYVMPNLMREFQLGPETVGLVNSASLAAYPVGALVLGWTDHIVRPFLISREASIPFIIVLFGVLGGLAAFGLVGLFVGPVILAVLLAIWREWLFESRQPAAP